MDIYSKKSYLRPIFLIMALLFLVSGCATVPVHHNALDRARNAYETARNTPDIDTNAPVALYDAKKALEKAESATDDIKGLDHLAYIAEKKAWLALLISQGKTSEKNIFELMKSKEKIVLKAREYEAENALAEAAKKTREAELARQQSEAMKRTAEEALTQKQQLEDELAALQAKQTDRGAVITLGNILFEYNKSALLPGGFLAIDKLSEFLKKYPTRNLIIEGHTDSRGSDRYNLGLSLQRATSVLNALLERGITNDRMTTKGHGKQYPVAGNETEAGRQQNRRVEVIILDEPVNPQ